MVSYPQRCVHVDASLFIHYTSHSRATRGCGSRLQWLSRKVQKCHIIHIIILQSLCLYTTTGNSLTTVFCTKVLLIDYRIWQKCAVLKYITVSPGNMSRTLSLMWSTMSLFGHRMALDDTQTASSWLMSWQITPHHAALMSLLTAIIWHVLTVISYRCSPATDNGNVKPWPYANIALWQLADNHTGYILFGCFWSDRSTHVTERSGRKGLFRGKRTIRSLLICLFHSPVKDLSYAAVNHVNRQRATL